MRHFFIRNKLWITIIISVFGGGMLFFMRKHQDFLAHWLSFSSTTIVPKLALDREQVSLWYWNHEVLCQEEAQVIFFEDKSATIKALIGSWLSLLYEERILEKIITVEEALLTASGQDVYVSFDHSLLEPGWSIYKKWKVIDGLLRTLRVARLSLQSIGFCVKHSPMSDDHLDFSRPWPILIAG